MTEEIMITLNYKGEDYNIIVDMQTAEILLNDPEKAETHMKVLLEEVEDKVSVVNHDIWQSKGRPSDKDEEATIFFLNLREKYSSKFDDKKTVKNKLWEQIAREMCEGGYNVGLGKEGGERCRQKFANMQKQYISHVKHMNKTGEEKKEPPSHYDQMHSILGQKHKINPQNLQDTGSDNESNSSEPSTSSTIKNRFSDAKVSEKPKTVNTRLLEEMTRQYNEEKEHRANDRQERKREFEILDRHLTKQNEQRDAFLKLFKSMVNKRKRASQESSSDEEN